MGPIQQLQKRYCSRALATAIPVWLLCYIAGQVAVGKGFLLGTLFSIVNFVLIGQAIPLQLLKSKRKTFFVSLTSMLIRYGVLAIPIIMAIKADQFNLYSTIIGLFTVQLMILLDHFGKPAGFTREKEVL